MSGGTDKESAAASTTAVGRRAEELALRYLQGKGYERLAQNARMGPLEIDLVLLDGGNDRIRGGQSARRCELRHARGVRDPRETAAADPRGDGVSPAKRTARPPRKVRRARGIPAKRRSAAYRKRVRRGSVASAACQIESRTCAHFFIKDAFDAGSAASAACQIESRTCAHFFAKDAFDAEA